MMAGLPVLVVDVGRTVPPREHRRGYERAEGEDRGRPGESRGVAMHGGARDQVRSMVVAGQVVRSRARRDRREQGDAERPTDLLRSVDRGRRDSRVTRLDTQRGVADRGGDDQPKPDAEHRQRGENVTA